jgi:hypothetical protein
VTALAARIREVQETLALLGDGPSEARALLVGELRGLRFARAVPADRIEEAAPTVTVTAEERAALMGTSPPPRPSRVTKKALVQAAFWQLWFETAEGGGDQVPRAS